MNTLLKTAISIYYQRDVMIEILYNFFPPKTYTRFQTLSCQNSKQEITEDEGGKCYERPANW